ncbi:MAG: hypothetical protein GY950_31230, partial [bacterium]|nr:hypothetical protein [bacterium]
MKRFMLTFIVVSFLFFPVFSGAEDCPKGNVITKMTSSMDSFKKALPLDFSKITSAGAMASK